MILQLCSRAYPREDRALVLSLAEELVDGGAPAYREAAGLVRGGLEARLRLSGAPWDEAFALLALPVAGLLLAAVVLGIAPYGQWRLEWIGWSWAAGLVGALAALSGRRWGAVLIVGLCAVDGWRDLYGAGSRWMALGVDVLPALLSAAVVLAVAARPHGARALAWTLAGAGLLVALAYVIRDHTTTGTTVLAAGGALVAVFTLRAPRGSEADRLAAAIALAAATPAACWSFAATVPGPDAYAYLALVTPALAAAAAILRLSPRGSSRPPGS